MNAYIDKIKALKLILLMAITLAIGLMIGSADSECPCKRKDIVAKMTREDDLGRMALAIKKSGLEDVLSGDETFTIFSPTNDAFDKIEGWTYPELILPENKAVLANIVRGHVTRGKITAQDMVDLKHIRMLNGEELPIEVSEDGITIGGATVLDVNLEAENGLIHVIDTVLMSR